MSVLAECSFDESENCGFQIIPDLDGVHHRELWTLSSGGSLGNNCPPSDHTPGLNQGNLHQPPVSSDFVTRSL